MKPIMLSILTLASLALHAQANEPCGNHGTIAERVADCNTKQGNFVLVTRTQRQNEIYKDIVSGLIWGDHEDAMAHTNYLYDTRACYNDKVGDERANMKNLAWRLPDKKQYYEAVLDGIMNSIPNFKNQGRLWTGSISDFNDRDGQYHYVFNTVDGDIDGNAHSRRDNYYPFRCVALDKDHVPTPFDDIDDTNEDEVVIKNPILEGSNLPIAASKGYTTVGSSEDGVCRALGYKRAIEGSSRATNTFEETLQIDENGDVIGGRKTHSMTKIGCIKKIRVADKFSTVDLAAKDLVHARTGLPYAGPKGYTHANSSEDGICRRLGYRKAVLQSGRTDQVEREVLRIDKYGQVIGGMTKTYAMTRLLCVIK